LLLVVFEDGCQTPPPFLPQLALMLLHFLGNCLAVAVVELMAHEMK
jgi:hypothetical protein